MSSPIERSGAAGLWKHADTIELTSAFKYRGQSIATLPRHSMVTELPHKCKVDTLCLSNGRSQILPNHGAKAYNSSMPFILSLLYILHNIPTAAVKSKCSLEINCIFRAYTALNFSDYSLKNGNLHQAAQSLRHIEAGRSSCLAIM